MMLFMGQKKKGGRGGKTEKEGRRDEKGERTDP